MVADQLRSGRKTATIRLGDKSRKYRKGMIVQVLAGTRFSPRQKIFDAVIDKVEVKTLADLSPREIEHDNPEIRRPEEMAGFLGQLYNREVADDELVTVIRFSEIRALGARPQPGGRRAAARRRRAARAAGARVRRAERRPCVGAAAASAAFAPAGLLAAMPGYVDGVLAAKLVAALPRPRAVSSGADRRLRPGDRDAARGDGRDARHERSAHRSELGGRHARAWPRAGRSGARRARRGRAGRARTSTPVRRVRSVRGGAGR